MSSTRIVVKKGLRPPEPVQLRNCNPFLHTIRVDGQRGESQLLSGSFCRYPVFSISACDAVEPVHDHLQVTQDVKDPIVSVLTMKLCFGVAGFEVFGRMAV